MPALAGEPWRGACLAGLRVTATPANNHQAWASFDVNTTPPTGDQSTWEGNPGDSLTLRFRWTTQGTGSATGAATTPNFATVHAMLPGGASLGSWAVAFPAVNTEVTRTFHFDDNPMNAVLGAIRSGMIELYVVWGNTGGVAPWSVDSRGATTGTILGTDEVINARGYARSRCVISNDPAPSNVAIGGAEPALFATPDPIHTRISLSAVKYRSVALELELLRTGSATIEREQTLAAQTAANHDYSWTGTAGTNRRVGNGMFLGEEAKDLRAKLSALDFGGDNEYVWAASGHAAGWTVDSDLQITNASELIVDPRFCLRNDGDIDGSANGALFHTQTLGQEFLDPPSFGDIGSGQRLFPDVGFVSCRYSNARGEGQNGLSVTLKMWDSGSIGSSESLPAHTFSGTTATRRADAPQTTPQAGWLPLAAAGVDNDKLPIVWSTVIGGTWRVKSVLTAPSDLTGLEAYPNSTGGDTWNRNLFLIVVNPNYVPVISIHPENITHHGTHLTPDDELIPVVYLIDQSTNKLVDLVEANGDGVNIKIVREHHPTMRMDYFDFDTEVWVGKANDGNIPSNLDLIRGDAHGSSLGTGDPDVWTTASHLGGDIFAPDGAAGELDAMIVADIVKDGSHYSAFAPVILVGKLNRHNVQEFDGTDFATGFPSM